MATLKINVNGTTRTVELDDPETPLLYVLRNDLGLTGTHFGCGLAQCGACTVLIDGHATRSCITPTSTVQTRAVTTIEGLGSPERPDPVQAAFIAEQAAQCDYCTFDAMRASAVVREQPVTRRGDMSALDAPGPGVRTLSSTYRWPVHSHASIGPSCGVADVRADRATIWTSSQGTHRYRAAFARILALSPERVRVIYLDGAGSYGQSGAEDAACDAALLSKSVGRPVRVQWTRQDEHGWDPKGPPQLLALRAAVDERGEVAAWETRAWLPVSTANLPNLPFLAAADAARIAQPQGRATGLIYQNIDPPYQYPNVDAVVRWIPDAPLRTSPIRAPGKIANSFAVESFVDEIAALAGRSG